MDFNSLLLKKLRKLLDEIAHPLSIIKNEHNKNHIQNFQYKTCKKKSSPKKNSLVAYPRLSYEQLVTFFRVHE